MLPLLILYRKKNAPSSKTMAPALFDRKLVMISFLIEKKN